MLDIKKFRENPEEIERRLKTRQADFTIAPVLKIDEEARRLTILADEAKNVRNSVSKLIGEKKRAKEDASKELEEMQKVSQSITEYDEQLRALEEERFNFMIGLPNLPHESVPVSHNKEDNQVVRTFGKKRAFDFEPKNHVELGKSLDLFDFERAVKIAKSNFPMYVRNGAKLEWALLRYMMDRLDDEGFELVIPPYLVNAVTMTNSGNLPKFEDQLFKCRDDELYLIPTSEVPLASIHREEIVPEADLPRYYCACTQNFRREAGAHGAEERGLIRVHQFNKVEMVKYVKPETSYDELEAMVKVAESIVEGLGLHFQTVLLVTGDIGQQSAKTYDVEVWLPGQNRYYEVSSCSNCEDYQARRGNMRYKDKETGKNHLLHTLNGSGLATSRLMVALIENHQNADGSVTIPAALRPYLRGLEVLKPV